PMEVEMAPRTILNSTDTWMEALEVSRDRVLAAARSGPHGAAVLAHAAAGRIVAAWTADPAPIDPVAHVEQTHAKGRRHLRRLLIDQAMRLLVQRAAALGGDDLDWQPPDAGWPLRRVLHHVARSEVLYAASFDEALPEEPAARYAEADARLSTRLVASRAAA